MSRDDDLERQLRSFGDTLRRHVGEPIDPDAASRRSDGDGDVDGRGGRRWIALVAAAVVVAVGVGLLAAVQRSDEANAPVATQPATPSTVPSTTTPSSLPADWSLIEHVVLVEGEDAGEPWTTELATSPDELAVLWSDVGLQGAPPLVNFIEDVVLYFNPAESGSCRFGTLDAVAYDPATGRVFPVLPFEDGAGDVIDGQRICTSDANPHAIVVEVARADLPSTDFALWVDNVEPQGDIDVAGVTQVAAGELLVPPTTSGPVDGAPVLIPGSFELGADDVIVRRVDGDVVLHPGALAGEDTEPVLLIDRDDPRPVPVEGEGPNVVDHVTGTYDGTLVYGDCCEPVAGNVFAIAEPGGEADLFTGAPTERAQRLGFGEDPTLEPGGSRLVTSNFAEVAVVDLATGARANALVEEAGSGPLTAAWTFQRTVVVVRRDDTGRILATEHDPQTLRELRQVVIDPTPRLPEVGVDAHVLDATDGVISVVLAEPTGSRIVDIDTSTFNVVSVDRPFTPPPTASVLRYSASRDAWAWIADDVAFLHTPDRGTTEWLRDVADVWFPTITDGTG